MAKTLESVATALGQLRKELMEEGYTAQEAFQIALDLIRRGSDPVAIFQD